MLFLSWYPFSSRFETAFEILVAVNLWNLKYDYLTFLFRLNFLSINRFERKKNIELAISAFAKLHKYDQDVLHGVNLADVSLSIAGTSNSAH